MSIFKLPANKRAKDRVHADPGPLFFPNPDTGRTAFCHDVLQRFFVFRWLHEISCRTPLVDVPLRSNLRHKAGHKAKKAACPLPWTDRSLPFACNDLSYQLI